MSNQILLLETEGNVLKKLQHNVLMQNLNAEMLYINDSEMGCDVISQRYFSVVVANFGSDLQACDKFCDKAHEQATFFIMFVLLVDKKYGEKVNKINAVHQSLASSCSEKEIVGAIARGIQVSADIQKNSRVAALFSKLDSLPSPPAVYFDLRDELGLTSCNTAALSKLIMRDQTLAARVLRVVNSGFYAMPRTISDLKQAIVLLGTETLLGLVLASHLFDGLPLPGLNLDNLWKHATDVALMAQTIARQRGANHEQLEASCIAGLLHDLGSLVFLTNQPAKYQAMLKTANGNEIQLIKSERDYFGVDHAELGSILLSLWGLPELVINAVQCHHDVDLQSTLADTSPSWSLVIAEWLTTISVSVTDENKQEIMNSCPFECTTEEFEQWRNAFEQLQA